MKKSLLPIKAMQVGCDRPVTTVCTERFGSVSEGPVDCTLTVVCRLTELSARSGSLSAPNTLAEFEKIPDDWGTTTILMIAEPLVGRPPRLQVTVAVPEQAP